MKRVAIILDENSHSTTCIAIDQSQAATLLKYVFRDNVAEEFRQIRDILKQNLRNKEKYCKCDISETAKDMFEMRFRRNGKNDRIYCKEIRTNKARIIIMCELLEFKKTQAIPKNIKERINTIARYEFEIIDK